VQQRVSLVTLGVADVERARAFYEALGWRAARTDTDDVVFFQAGGLVLALWDRGALAADAGVPDAGGFGGIALAHNVGSPDEVEGILKEARAAGARVTRPGGATFWGGYSGAFTDPDGHPWEVAHNPFWTLEEDGSVRIEPA
jgi:catechol 2,3-dioxygenase-like lactoylglutathione lyase family enzyme